MVKLFRFLKPYLLLLTIVIILILLQSLLNLYLPILLRDIVNEGVTNNDIDYIINTGGKMLLIAFIATVFMVIAAFISSYIGNSFGRDIRREVFSRVESFSLNEFDKLGTSTLITRSTNDITQVQNVTLMMMRIMVMAPMMMIGGIIMAIGIDGQLTKILLVSLPLITIAILIIAAKGIPLFRIMQVKLDKLNLVLREYLTGVRVIRAFNKTEQENLRFNEANLDLTNTAIKVNRIMALLWPLMMLIMNFTVIAIIWFGGIRIDQGTFLVGDLLSFIQFAMQIMFSLLMVTMIFVMIPRAQASAIRINEVLDTVSDINDPENEIFEDNLKGYVEFKNVSFHYLGAEEPAIQDISFSCKPGEVTAIIGSTGSGKSTLIHLIPRFYDITKGEILVDGVDIRDMSQEKLRNKIGFVPQKAVLFTGSIKDNIAFGKEEASIEEITNASKTAQAYDFIMEIKDDFNSIISQGGTNLSGGQKQRISIARALVRQPEIYIFDDSFSALDFKTDAKLRHALKEKTQKQTIIIVAQRVATIMNADQIIVLEEGKIAGIGKHQDLFKNCEVYNEIVTSQLQEEELA